MKKVNLYISLVMLALIAGVTVYAGNDATKDKNNSNNRKIENSKPEENGVIFSITDAVRWGNKMLVFYTIKNNTDDNLNYLNFYLGNTLAQNESNAAFDNGKTCWFIHEDYLRNNKDVPSRALRRGALCAEMVPAKAKTVNLFLTGFATVNGSNKKFNRQFKNVPIRGFQASNLPGSFISHPNIKMNVNSVAKEGNNICINLSLTNLDEEDITFNMYADRGEAYDSYGKTYKLNSDVKTLRMRPEKPLTFTINVMNVPQSATEFQSVVLPLYAQNYELPEAFHIVLNDIAINK